MVVPTHLGSVDVVTANDLMVWVLPATDPQPYPGATLHGEGFNEDGELCRLWWAYAARAESCLRPRPTAVFRGYVVDDGTGSTTRSHYEDDHGC